MQTIKRPTEREIRRSLGLLTVTEAAREIGEEPRLLWYHQGMGYCVQPSTRLEGESRLYYRRDELPTLRRYFVERGHE